MPTSRAYAADLAHTIPAICVTPEPEMTGSGAAMTRLRLQLRRVGPHFRTVLLRGERGSGKAFAARALHHISPAAEGPFVVCSAATLEASSHASQNAADHIERAVRAALGGTLFLDKIGDMSLEAQDHLMRVMRRQEWGRHGLATPHQKMDLRIIASTSDDLRILASAGRFRPELFRQITMVEITVPPLRERIEDIPELAAIFLIRLSQESGRQIDRISEDAIRLLQTHRWPGNLQELEDVLHDAMVRCQSTILETSDLPELTGDISSMEAGMTKLQDVVERHVLQVLRSCGGNKLRAAEVLGISRSTLYRMLDASVSID